MYLIELDQCLWISGVHINHSVDVLLHVPLPNDESVHPAEQGKKKHDLRDKFEEEIQPVFEVKCIETLHNDTEGHLQNSENDGCLHFVVIGECEKLVTLEPPRVET